MVDLLQRHHRQGRRFEPAGFIEEGRHVAVRLNVSDVRWQGETAQVYKVFTFREDGMEAELFQDCVDREDALGYLRSG